MQQGLGTPDTGERKSHFASYGQCLGCEGEGYNHSPGPDGV